MEKKSPLLKGHQDIVSIIYSNRLLFMKNLLRDPAFYNDHARQFPWTAHQSFPWIDQRAMNPWTPEVDEELSSPTPPALFDAGLPGWGFKFFLPSREGSHNPTISGESRKNIESTKSAGKLRFKKKGITVPVRSQEGQKNWPTLTSGAVSPLSVSCFLHGLLWPNTTGGFGRLYTFFLKWKDPCKSYISRWSSDAPSDFTVESERFSPRSFSPKRGSHK